MTKKIDVINSMLATMGTSPLSAADTGHPLYATANQKLEELLEEFCTKQMWFNTHKRTLVRDTSNRVVVPEDSLSVQSTTPGRKVSVRGQYLFDDNDYTFEFDCDQEVIVIRNTPIEEMPPAAVQYIRAVARYEYFLDKDGDAQKVQAYAAAVQRKEVALSIQNTKQLNANWFNGDGAASFYTRRDATNLNGAGGRIKIR